MNERMSSFELEMRELIDMYIKLGFSKEYIYKNCQKVVDKMRDPEPEIKGEWDT